MFELVAPDVALGALALAVVVLYGAWQEFANTNPRDAKLLAALGSLSLGGSIWAWVA